eukprot:5093550-Amphidinium_carterae.1
MVADQCNVAVHYVHCSPADRKVIVAAMSLLVHKPPFLSLPLPLFFLFGQVGEMCPCCPQV